MSTNPKIVLINNLRQAKEEIARIGADDGGIEIMKEKAVFYTIKVEAVPGKASIIIKQVMLSNGGECAVPRATLLHPEDRHDILLMGTLKQFRRLCANLKRQPFGLASLAGEILEVIKNAQGYTPYNLKCGKFSLPIGRRTLVMGILNITPDSFSDGGKFYNLEAALEQARTMIDDGADIIDVGGESTRPSFEPVPAEEELRRVLPVIEHLAGEISVPISVDTYKAVVAKEAVAHGATIVNDIWGLRADKEMAKTIAELDVPYIMMHNQDGTDYRDLMGDMIAFFRDGINQAVEAGAKPENIILDPGIGFGKTLDQNLETMHHLRELRTLGQPILLGTSRKSFIGKTLDLPVEDRVEGTAASVALGIAYGADIVRVHDVKAMVRVARMTDAMVYRN